jgi:acyl-CoA thioesterase-1
MNAGRAERIALKLLLSLACALAATGCGSRGSALLPSIPPRADRLSVVFLGDSLTAGNGVASEQAFPALMQRFWTTRGVPYVAVNEGVSGDTTEDVLARLSASRGPSAELTIVEIGANDAFQEVPVKKVEANLVGIVRALKSGGTRVAISSMYFGDGFLPAGNEYTKEFNGLYARVGKAENVPVLPPLLRGLERADLWQADGLHPTDEGHAIIARNLLGDLNPAWRE